MSFNFETAGVAAFTMGMIDTACTLDFIRIEASNAQTGIVDTMSSLRNNFCGGILNDFNAATVNSPIRDCTQPFQVCFVTDDMPDATVTTVANGNRGFCLDYRQEPC